jgi:OPT family small oligopeptide transporter
MSAPQYEEKTVADSHVGVHNVEGQDYSKEDEAHLYDNNYDPATAHDVPVDGDIEEDSPYPEVRAAVSNFDDPEMPVNTFRMWLLGIIWCIILAGVNQFFFFRYPNVTIPPIIAQLLSYPMGRAMHKIMPKNRWGNPGPFNIKEHTMISIMSSVSAYSAYATDIIAVQRFFYNQNFGYGYQLMLVLSTQMIGFCLGGLLRKMLVWPSSMIWPATLVSTALFNTLHSRESGGSAGGISRERFFAYGTIGMFVWSFFPNYIFSALSYFDWVTWIAPDNQKVNLLFGYQSGAGMSVLTFDWGQISGIGNPMATPWWATANILAGFLFFIWFLCPILYYTNTFYFSYLPFSSSTSYDHFGHKYNVTKIINADASFNEEAYKAYSPLMLSTTFAISYGLSFAALSATVVHTFLYYRKQIWNQARRSIHDADDIHLKLMSVYPEVPQWWYIVIFLVNLALAIGAIRGYPTQMPVWSLFLALLLSIVLSLPIGMIQAITNTQVGLNVITEFIIGYAVPGKPVSMMIFKTYGYITMAQGMSFINDMKLGHYMKVPPRIMFWGQVWGTLIAGIVQVFVQAWLFGHVEGICDRTATETWWCPSTQVFGTASIIWGVIGPARFLGANGIYKDLMWFWLIGAACPIPCYFLAKRYPKSFWKYVNFPVIFSGTGLMPPYLPINFISYIYTGFIFQYVIRRRNFNWWSRYNYVLSAAWSCGYALSILFIFFCLQYPLSGAIGPGLQAWWGNTVYNNVLDASGLAGARFHVNATAGEYFGPVKGSWA